MNDLVRTSLLIVHRVIHRPDATLAYIKYFLHSTPRPATSCHVLLRPATMQQLLKLDDREKHLV